MKCGIVCRWNATGDTLFRSAKTVGHQLQQMRSGVTGRSQNFMPLFFLGNGHTVDKGTDDAGRQFLMLDHRQMTAVAQQHGLRLGQKL